MQKVGDELNSFPTSLKALERIASALPSTTLEPQEIEELTNALTDAMVELTQLRAFADGSYKTARDILAATMNIGELSSDETFKLATTEIDAVADNIEQFHKGYLTELGILNERLMRRYDPGMAWNEAINRAIESKKIDPQLMLTTYQMRALEVQQKTTRDRLRNF